MEKGQISKRGGYEDILFPMTVCNITQGDFEGTHAGTYAVDLAGKDTGRDLFYAPFSVVCKAIDSVNGNAVWWESQNKVRFADGTIDYATIMIVHDNSLGGIYVGAKYKQGIQIAQEGTAGKATGNHLHFEIAKGKYDHMYDQNSYGTYHLPNNMPMENACFMDNTEIIRGKADWKYLKDVKVESKPSKPSKKPDQVLSVGSVVTSVAMKVAIPKGKSTAVDTINGDECIYVPALGGYFPTRFLSEADASDGKKDNYFANTKAKVYVNQTTVQDVNEEDNLVMIHGIWVKPAPLTEIKEGK